MGAGVKIIEHTGGILHSFQIIGKGLTRKTPCILLCGAAVQRIRRVRQNNRYAVFSAFFQKGCNIVFIYIFRLAAARISGKELKRICANGERLFQHMGISFGCA